MATTVGEADIIMTNGSKTEPGLNPKVDTSKTGQGSTPEIESSKTGPGSNSKTGQGSTPKIESSKTGPRADLKIDGSALGPYSDSNLKTKQDSHPKIEAKEKKLSVSKRKQFEQGDAVTDMPSWYNEDGRKSIMVSRKTILSHSRVPSASRRTLKGDQSKHMHSADKKTEIVRPQKQKKIIKWVNLDEEQQNIGACYTSEAATVRLELDMPSAAELELENQWICRPAKPGPRMKRAKRRSEIKLQAVLRKFDKAIALLVDQVDKGLLTRPSIQTNDSELQYKIDMTLSPPQSNIAQGPSGYRSKTISKSTVSQMPTERDNESLTESSGRLCRKDINKALDEYVNEPLALHLLRKVGVVNAEGEILCELKDFDEVEQRVKMFLIDAAQQLPDRATTKCGSIPSYANARPKAADTKNERRAQLRSILMEEMAPQEQEIPEPLENSAAVVTSSLRGKSMGLDKSAKVVERFNSGLGHLGNETPVKEASLLEILPFEDRDSFDQDQESGCVKITLKPSGSSERIHGLIYEDDEMDIPSEVKAEGADQKQMSMQVEFDKKQTFREWENLRLCEELRNKGNLNKSERFLVATVKFFYKWLNKTRLNQPIRDCSACPFTSLWAGPYFPYVLNRIRERDGNPNYVPKSTKEFYGKVKQMQRDMYDAILGNCHQAQTKAEAERHNSKPLTGSLDTQEDAETALMTSGLENASEEDAEEQEEYEEESLETEIGSTEDEEKDMEFEGAEDPKEEGSSESEQIETIGSELESSKKLDSKKPKSIAPLESSDKTIQEQKMPSLTDQQAEQPGVGISGSQEASNIPT